MTEPHVHASHPRVASRLKRAEGHLRSVIAMIEEGRPCLDVAQQLQAVERAVRNAKQALIQSRQGARYVAQGPSLIASEQLLTHSITIFKF